MKCPSCQHENPEGVKFCNECGAAFAQDGTEDRFSIIADYVPPELRERILQAGKQLESERRFVTVVFADASGFTPLSEKLDPEIVTSVMNDFFRGMISIILKYEGMIIDFFGDGILCIFGAPLAHENDPERAIRSSLEMMDYAERFNRITPHNLPSPMGLHIGINSGTVVTGNVGSDLRMRYSAVGNTVNMCSRIADNAPEGEIHISEDTHRLVSSIAETDGPHSIKVKGKEGSLPIYKLLSIKEGIESASIRKSGFVGRKEERVIISQLLDDVLEKKEQRLFIRGEPGVGKTRLKEELIAEARSKGIAVYEGQCSSFVAQTPYYLWNSLLKSMLRINLEASETETKNQLHDSLEILSLGSDEPYIATLLSLRYEEILLEEDQERKGRIFEAMGKLINAFGKRQPTAFVLEDLHWVDRFSKELLEFLFAKDGLAPSLSLFLYRPEYTVAEKVIGQNTVINLDRLSDADAIELMKDRLGVETIPDEVQELLLSHAEGNPFFIEESIKSLLDKGIISVRRGKVQILSEDLKAGVPETIQSVIMARIDRLEEKIREVLLGASVVGREFSRSVLEHVIKKKEEVLPSLRHLKGLEMVLEKEEAQELEYLFKHYLIQEVAYNTILIKKRKELHRLIAQAMEEVYADRLKELYELVAFHYEKAEDWEKAAEYLSRAGRKVRELYTSEESVDFHDRKATSLDELYQTGATKKSLAFKFFIAIVFVFFTVGGSITIFGAGKILRNIIPAFTGSDLPDALLIIVWGITVILIVYAWLMYLFYFILPAFQRTQNIDLVQNGIQVVWGRNRSFSLPYSDFDSIDFRGKARVKSRPWWHNLFDFSARIERFDAPSIRDLLFHELMGNFRVFYFGQETRYNKIFIRRKGERYKGILLLLRRFSPERFPLICLCPSDPEEFHNQLVIVFKKWKREQETGELLL